MDPNQTIVITVSGLGPSTITSSRSTVIENIVCDLSTQACMLARLLCTIVNAIHLDEFVFIAVSPVTRLAVPRSRRASHCEGLRTTFISSQLQ